MLIQTVDPTLIAGNSPVLWAMIVAVGALSSTVVYLARRNFRKGDEFVTQHQDLLRETLGTIHDLETAFGRVADEVPRMSGDVKTAMKAEGSRTRDLLTTRADRLETLLENAKRNTR